MELTEDSQFEGEGIRVLSEEGNGPIVHSAQAAPAAPVVVIEYREKGLWHRFLPALLVLLAAIAISSFQRPTPVRLIPNRAVLVASKPTKPAPPTPILAKLNNTLDPGLTKTASKPSPDQEGKGDKPPVSLFEIDPSDGLIPIELSGATPGTKEPDEPDFVVENPSSPDLKITREPEPIAASDTPPTPDNAEAAPVAEAARAEPTKDDILNDIRREAEEKESERKRLADLKPQAKALVLAESIERAQSDRQPFHNALKELIQSNDPDLYQMVDNLCNRYGRSLSDELKARYLKARKVFPKRMSRQAEVIAMRKLGLPEPMILDYLVNNALKSVNGRSGPADERAAVIAASKQLLAIGVNSKDASGKSASSRKAVPTSAMATGDPAVKNP